MIIDYDKLIDILMRHAEWRADDVAPDKAFAIRFGPTGKHRSRQIAEYESMNGTVIYLDVTDNGMVDSIEFV